MAKQEKQGDCYEANFLKFCQLENEAPGEYRLIHAEVMGGRELEGVQFGHAFLLHGPTMTVLDFSNGEELRMPYVLYSAKGNIDLIDNWHSYEFDEALEKALETEVYGPWDLETSTGL